MDERSKENIEAIRENLEGNRTFEILRRERALTQEERAANRSAIAAGVSLLATAGLFYLSGAMNPEIFQQEFQALMTFEGFWNYVNDLGPGVILGIAYTVLSSRNYRRHRENVTRLTGELLDLEAINRTYKKNRSQNNNKK